MRFRKGFIKPAGGEACPKSRRFCMNEEKEAYGTDGEAMPKREKGKIIR